MRVDGDEVHLTPIEFDLLRTLARNRGRLLTHRALLVEVWGPEYANDTAVLRTHIANLRRKIEPAARTSAPTPASATASRRVLTPLQRTICDDGRGRIGASGRLTARASERWLP